MPAIWATFSLFQAPIAAQSLDAPIEKIAFTSSDTLRDFVGTHLGDPDLWPYVLDLNQLDSPADLKPGVILNLPVQQVKAADNALNSALVAIQNATAEGAQLFAPQEIGEAISNREDALQQRDIGAWRNTVDLSDLATLLAKEALDIAIAQRDRSAEAIVSDVQGNVEGRAPVEPRWSDRTRDDVLVEFERLRTLSKSTTQVTFRDLSRLRLNANSNATIQRMRSDPLTGDETTKVSLVSGDFYALLNQLSDKTSFEIDVPGVDTKTQSTDFWVSNSSTGARFVNYDDADLQIQRGETAVVLGENEGAVLDRSGARTQDVLDSPLLSAPEDAAILYSATVDLQWTPFEAAAGYWLEVASDAGYNLMNLSEWGIETPAFTTPPLPAGKFYWRVAVLDQLGLPGQWSRTHTFTIRQDGTPPFLTLLAPGNDTISETPIIEVFGASEPDAEVLLNDAPVTLGGDGSFIVDLTLQQGENAVLLKATDQAGNVSEINQTVFYRPTAAVEIIFDADLPRAGAAFATRSESLAVRAKTTAQPRSPVVIRDALGMPVVQTRIDTEGVLAFSLPVNDTEQSFDIEISAPTGTIEGRKSFTAVRDQIPPVITLDAPPPKATDDPFLQLDGIVTDAVSITLNEQPLTLNAGRFQIEHTLEQDANALTLRASDAVGNLTVLRLQTVYDITPPDISNASAQRLEGQSGPIEITAQASDVSGLRKSATFLIEIGSTEREGFMICHVTQGSEGLCRATLPPESGTLRLIEVAIEDYAGNTAYR